MSKIITSIIDWSLTILLTVVGAFVLIALMGCQSVQSAPNVNTNPGSTIIWNTIKSTDWLASIFLIGFTLSVVGIGLGMTKLGVSCSIACIAGLFLKAALSNPWFYWGATLLVLSTIITVIAGVLFKNKAIKELILGAQQLKDTPDESIDRLWNGNAGKVLASVQSKPTIALVNQVKAAMKTQGII